jgi:hypothetical protein
LICRLNFQPVTPPYVSKVWESSLAKNVRTLHIGHEDLNVAPAFRRAFLRIGNARLKAGTTRASPQSRRIKRLEARHSFFELAFSVPGRQDGSGEKDFEVA